MFQFTPVWILLLATTVNAINGTVALNETLNSGEKSVPRNEMIPATLPFVLRPAGLLECQGADQAGAGKFFEQILGSDLNNNQSSYLCGPTCQGKCIPRPADIGIPSDNFPYGCLCTACDLNGPMFAPMAKPYFKMVCQREKRCTCFGMGPGQFDGYSCQWINTISGKPITFMEKPVMLPGTPGRPPVPSKGAHRFSPIRWCSCCPRQLVVQAIHNIK